MTSDRDVLKEFDKYPLNERAAALSHWIYVYTSKQDSTKWPLRVSSGWDDMETKAKEFNVATIDTWARHPELLEAWVHAVNAYRAQLEDGRSADSR